MVSLLRLLIDVILLWLEWYILMVVYHLKTFIALIWRYCFLQGVDEKKCAYALGVRVITAVQEDITDIHVEKEGEIRLDVNEGPNKTVR